MNNQKVYRTICWVLSDRSTQVEWETLTPQEWSLLWRQACAEGVAPLLYRKLDSVVGIDGQSVAVRRQLSELKHQAETEYYQSLAQNQLLFHELGGVLTALEDQGIQVILLKGAALAQTLYEDIGLRLMNDLDLLVRREEIDLAMGILQRHGYTEFYPQRLGMPRGVDQAVSHERHLRGGLQENLAIELHWNLISGEADRRSPPADWPWEESIPFDTSTMPGQGGVPLHTWILSPAASLLYAAAHLVLQHGPQARMLWYYDLHLMLTRWAGAIRWEELPQIAGRLGWADALALGLQEAQAYFATPLPPGLLESLAPYSDPAARRIIDLRASAGDERQVATLVASQVYDLPTRLRLAVALAFPSPEYMRWRYQPSPEWVWPAYYLVRAWKMLQYGFMNVRALGSRK